VLQAFAGEGSMQGAGPDAAAAVPGLVEHLTGRELEVLALLAAGRPNPPNRTEAVTRARQPGPIP